MSNIVWLASFPKSGNTWVRIFLNNYVSNLAEPVSINQLDEGTHASSRVLFDRLVGVDSSELLPEEVDRLRPLMYLAWAEEVTEPLFVKVHEKWRLNDEGLPLFPPDATRSVIYIVRNPLDVVPSLANHMGQSLDQALASLNERAFMMARSRRGIHRQFEQWVGSWSDHVRSWLDESGLPVLLIRYEDLHTVRYDQTFAQLVRVAGLPFDQERLAKSIRFSSFPELKKQEQEEGFVERLHGSAAFFNKGKIGRGRNLLTAAQQSQIIDTHGEMMRRLGYLDDDGQPVF